MADQAERAGGVAEKRMIEAMVTAVLAGDPLAQKDVVRGLPAGEERLVRAAASILAGIFTALGERTRLGAARAWQIHLGGTNMSRET